MAVLPIIPTFINAFTILTFLSVAVRDMWRRRALMRSCAALLSSKLADRVNVPPEVAGLGILDLRDPETVQGCRMLVALCKGWGRFFAQRCVVFFGMFAAVGGLVVTYLTLLILADASKLLSRQLLYAGVNFSIFIGIAVISLVILGEGANKAVGRVGQLLQNHSAGLQSYLAGVRQLPLTRRSSEDLQKLTQAAQLLEVTYTAVLAEAENEPFELLGQYCGYRLLAAIYAVPAFAASTIVTYCGQNSDMCAPRPVW